MQIKGLSSIKERTRKYRENPTIKSLLTVLSMDILVRLSNVILLPVYLKLMTQEEYGIYNYILSIITTFSVVLNFGLYVSQARYYSAAQSDEQKKIVLFNTFILLTGLLGVIIFTAYFFKIDYILIKLLFKNDIHYGHFRWSMLLAVIVSVYTVILTNFFIISERIKVFRKYNMYRLIFVHIVVLSFLYYTKQDKINVRLLYTYLTELAVLAVFFTWYAREMFPVIDRKIIFNSLKLGAPIMFSAIWGLVSNYSDKFFLEKKGTATDLSYYYLAFSLGNILYMICTAAQNAWLPTFLKETDLDRNVSRTNQLIRKLVMVLLALGAMLMAGLFIAIKMGVISDKYMPALYILPFLLLAQIINGVVLLYSNYMIYFEKTHWSLFVGIFTSLIGLTGSYFLVPAWGVFGAVTVYLVVQITYLCIYYQLIRYKIKKNDPYSLKQS